MLLNCDIGEDAWESLGLQEIQPIHPKGNQSWVFTGRIDVESETPILWPPDEKSWLIWKDPDARKDWRQEEKGTTEEEMVGCHHWLNHMSLSKLQELVNDREAWSAVVHGVPKSWTWMSDWTELNLLKRLTFTILYFYFLWHFLINHISEDLFLGSPFCLTELYISSCVSTNLFWLL